MMTRNDPYDPSGQNVALRHLDADHAHRRHLGDERAVVEHDCCQAAAESLAHQRARRAGHSAECQAVAPVCRVRCRSDAVREVDS